MEDTRDAMEVYDDGLDNDGEDELTASGMHVEGEDLPVEEEEKDM